MNRFHVLLISTLLLTLLCSPTHAQPPERKGWFFGGSISLFEAGLSGKILTPGGDINFDVQDPNAASLVDNRDINASTAMGLGWENTQLPGGKLFIGYRSGFHFATHLDLFWALPKVSEQRGYPGDNPAQYYLDMQSTRWTYKSTRFMVDWRPFRPLPLWFLTAGVEYVEFDTQLEFRWQSEVADQTYRYFENYVDGGNTFGFVIGSGLQFNSKDTPRQEWFINMTYSYAPFNDPYFAWDSDLLVGGISLEGGVRLFPGRK